MKLFAAVLILCVAFASADFKEKTEDDFLKASEVCAKQEKVPESLLKKFENFEYPDEDIVRRFILCVFLQLGLFDEKTGFHVEHMADLYKDRANTEVLIPVLSECNKNVPNDNSLAWAYRGFICILRSEIGNWFKDDMIKQAAKAKN